MIKPISKGFTLVEALLVVGFLAVVATVVVVVLNPAQFLDQSRDSRRVEDLKALNRAMEVAIYSPELINANAAVVYISLPSLSSDCAHLLTHFPGLVAGWGYRCANQTNF